jgi:hypothetical protein
VNQVTSHVVNIADHAAVSTDEASKYLNQSLERNAISVLHANSQVSSKVNEFGQFGIIGNVTFLKF